MAGKAKKKLDYAGWSVDIFDSDTKIDKLLDAQGWVGFSVYFYLCQRAFGSEVSALAAEWIEISLRQHQRQLDRGLRPRGGVD